MRLLIFFMLSPFFLFSQTQIGNDINGELTLDNSGHSVSTSSNGSIVAIGSPSYDGVGKGLVRVFENNGDAWIQIGEDIGGEFDEDHFGSSVSLSGDGSIVAIGGPDSEIAGIARVYENIGNVWTQIGSAINGDVAGDNFGRGVNLSDNGTILSIIGRNYTRIYENISGVWSQIGSDISLGGSSSYGIGGELAILSGDGSVVAISEWFYDSWLGYYTSQIVYENISGTWTQIGSPFFGFVSAISLSHDGSIMATNSSLSSDGVVVYENVGNVWTQIGNPIEVADYYSISLSLSSNGDIIAIEGDFSAGNENVSIYRNINNDWTQLGTTINGGNDGDNFGTSLELSSDASTLVVGAPNNDSNGIDSGHARVYDLTAVLSTNDYTLSQFRMYPNPAKNQVTIQLNTTSILKQITVYNMLGQEVLISEEKIVNTSKLASGSYIVEVNTNNGKASKKLIIE